MQIHRDLSQLPVLKNAVVSIGSFDGIHLGHQKIIRRVIHFAQMSDGESVIITFHPHPRQVIYPKDKSLQLLTTLEEKIDLLSGMGVHHLVIVPFTVEFSQISPRQYVEDFLISSLQVSHLIIGYDHKFGFNRQGDIRMLKEYEKKGRFRITEIPQQEIEELTISSTKIRNALLEADMEKAHRFLGRPYSLAGTVIRGSQIGKSIGFPTANLKIPDPAKCIPAEGIYAVRAELESEILDGMMYIGNNPTLKDNAPLSIEVHLFDFSGNIYGKKLGVKIYSYLREDQKFEDLESLRSQIERDGRRAHQILDNVKEADSGKRKLAIVLLNYNGLDFLESFLPLMLESSQSSFSIFLIDNNSTDDSLEYVREWHPEVNIIELDQNYGFAGGYNRGLAGIQAEYYIIINSDIKVEDLWLDPLVELMDTDKNIACVQPKIKSLENPLEFEYAGGSGGFLDIFYYPLCRGRVFESVEQDMGQYDNTQEVFWASGAAMVIRAELFHKVGGFDDSFFAHQEEIDLCWRLKNAGYKIMVCPKSSVFHFGGGTLSYDHPQKSYLNFRNNHLCYLKNELSKHLWWKVPIRWILDGCAFIKFITEGKFLIAFSIIRAYFYLFFRFGRIMEKRKLAKRQTQLVQIGKPNKVGKLKIFAAWSYYVKGKQKFYQIIKP